MSKDLPDDFSDYAEGIARQQEAEEIMFQKAREHEIWLKTSWAGYFVGLSNSFGQLPFMISLREGYSGGQSSVAFRATKLIVKIAIILVGFMSIRMLAMMLQKAIGTEYVYEVEVEEKVVVKRKGSETQIRRGKKDA